MHDRCIERVVQADEANTRLDVYVTALDAAFSRAQVRRWIDEGLVLVNGSRPAKAGVRLRPGDRVEVWPPPPEPAEAEPQAIPLEILYEDAAIIVVNKPKGMVVHPAPGHAEGTLVNALLHHCPDLAGIGGVRRPGIVHRLDKETSGLMVVAKSEAAHRALVQALKERRVSRQYLAIVHGIPSVSAGTIDAPIGRHPRHRQKMAVLAAGGREAITHFRVLEAFERFSLLELSLATGRTHQIRVHLAHIGHPVAGDTRYGPRRPELFDDGQALHAFRLRFAHPTTGEPLTFEAPPPPRFLEVLEQLRKERAPKEREATRPLSPAARSAKKR